MGTLLAGHRKQLIEESGIDPDIVAERGYYSLHRGSDSTDAPANLSKLKAMGMPRYARDSPARLPGLVLPQHRPTGERTHSIYRFDHPPRDPQTGKQIKYATPTGRTAALDVHPRNVRHMDDPTREL